MNLIIGASHNEEYLKRKEAEEAQEEGKDGLYSSKRKREFKEVYIPEAELEELRERYSHMIVQDFEDDFHMKKEERDNQRARFAKFYKLKQDFPKKIRRIDKFVEAYRLVMEIIDEIAETNGAMNPDEFKLMVLRREIDIAGLQLPKFIGKGRKSLNWNNVVQYILDPSLNAMDLTKDSLRVSDEYDEDGEISLSEDEMKEIMSLVENVGNINEDVDRPPLPDVEDNGPSFVAVASKKDKKVLKSDLPNYQKVMKQIDRRDSKRRENAMIWQLNQDDMKWIEEYDRKHNRGSNAGVPQFKGDIMNKDDVEAYIYAVDEYLRETELVETKNGGYITREDAEELEFKETLEACGYNLRNLYGNKKREKEKEKADKAKRKKIKSLKKMLVKLEGKGKDSKVKGLTGDISEIYEEDMESKGGINKKKKKSKASKKAKKRSKAMDPVLTDFFGEDSMKDVKKKMKNMSLLDD